MDLQERLYSLKSDLYGGIEAVEAGLLKTRLTGILNEKNRKGWYGTLS